MTHASACTRSRAVRAFRTTVVALAASSAVAAPLAAVLPAATASTSGPALAARAPWTGPVVTVSPSRSWFSPDGDDVQDKARFWFTVEKPAEVTVKVRRDDKAQTLVYKEELGELAPGTVNRWSWKGKDRDRDVVRDGRYRVVVTADQVGADGKKRIRSALVHVDTHFDVPAKPTLSLDTVYPRTTQIHDAVGVTLAGKGRTATVGSVVLRVKDDQGRVVRRVSGSKSWWYRSLTVAFDGRDQAGAPLPGGTYTLGFKVLDNAGNQGRSTTIPVHVAAKPLVEKTGTLVVPPSGTWKASALARGVDGRSSTTGGDDPQPTPCGTVVPSEVYPNAGAKSYRSADTCTGYLTMKMAWAYGYLSLDHLAFADAPRGVLTSRVSMRGRPTVAGETDTAELFHGGSLSFDGTGTSTTHGVSSPAVAQETTTSSGTLTTAAKPYYGPVTVAPSVNWTIATRGVDSFDVAEVTVDYTYLTPQP